MSTTAAVTAESARVTVHDFKVTVDEQGMANIEPKREFEFQRGDKVCFTCDQPSFNVIVAPTKRISPLEKTLEAYQLTHGSLEDPERPGYSELAVELTAEGVSREAVEEALTFNNELFVGEFTFTLQGQGIPADTKVRGTWVHSEQDPEKDGGVGTQPVGSDEPVQVGAKLNGPIDLSKPLNLDARSENQEAVERFLGDVQANVIKGHGREFGRYLMIRIDRGKRGASAKSRSERRMWLSALAGEIVSPALTQRKQTEQWKAKRSQGREPNGGPIGIIGITSDGYDVLGLSERQPRDFEFRHSMRNLRPRDYKAHPTPWDPGQERWEPAYGGGTADEIEGKRADGDSQLHLMIHLADDNEDRLEERAVHLKRRIAEFGEVVADEHGKRRIHKHVDSKKLIEHFGFVDGISAPKFIKQDAPKHRHWPKRDGAVRLDLLFVRECPLVKVTRPRPSYGSYGAFMKLEQNVKLFRDMSERLAQELNVCPHQAAALAVGRHQTGLPLVAEVGEKINDFDYSGEHADLRCPLHSHTRRMNVRRGSAFTLARRGMHYGPEREDLYPGVDQRPPEKGVGLLFLSFQSSIARFSSRMFAALEPPQGGVDALIGRSRGDAGDPQDWETRDGNPVPIEMADFVTARGGEYFFFPSISFFRHLPAVRD